MRIDVLTIFPEIVDGFTSASLIGKAQAKEIINIKSHDLRSFSDPKDVHRSVDGAPYGGGPGMVMSPGPVFDAIESGIVAKPVIYLNPAGRRFDQQAAVELSQLESFTLLCGRFEGLDERARSSIIDDEISIGDYVLAGGEVAAAAVIEAVCRLVPGVLGNVASTADESFSDGLLEYPQYTRPADFRGQTVPAELVSGDHALVARWRQAQALHRTLHRRPDLIAARGGLSEAEQELMALFEPIL